MNYMVLYHTNNYILAGNFVFTVRLIIKVSGLGYCIYLKETTKMQFDIKNPLHYSVVYNPSFHTTKQIASRRHVQKIDLKKLGFVYNVRS